MALSTKNWIQAEYELPSLKENERQQTDEPNPQFSLFWECPKCHAAILFCIEDCHNCKAR